MVVFSDQIHVRSVDRILTAVLAALMVFTPFAVGSVYRWAFTSIEVAVFGLLILWATKVAFAIGPAQSGAEIQPFRSRSLLPPALIFGALIVLQLFPLPPVLVRFLSPSTYNVLAHSLPAGFAGHWYPLSIAPSLTETALLKFCAYVGLFFLVLAYPFVDGVEGESRFYRRILATVVITGFLVAVVGLVERVYWNGKILWFVVPQDWGAPRPGAFPRATGPFVDPDHFANYLSMAFPLALAGVYCGLSAASIQRSNAFRLLWGVMAFIILLAIALSLSRAEWIGATVAGLLFSLFYFDGWLVPSRACNQSDSPEDARFSNGLDQGRPFDTLHRRAVGRRPLFRYSKAAALSLSLVAIVTLVIFALFIVGPAGRAQADIRVGDTISGGDLAARTSVWKDTLRMIRDFPVFGIGLGGWPEIFPHYESAPWSPFYFRQVHNDYLQLAAETGLVGILALIWFFALVVAMSYAAVQRFSARERTLFIALGLALFVTASHELVDFCLRMPANAFLFTLLLAVAVRMAVTKTQGDHLRGISGPVAAGCVAVVSAVLIVLALGQKGLSYPYDIEQPSSLAWARAQVQAHPASAEAHLYLLNLAGHEMRAADRLAEIEAAVFLDPNNPYVRDLYAQYLALAGRQNAALEQMTLSVFNSPTLETHFYLSDRTPLLSQPERNAVEDGFQKAIAARYPEAVVEFGAFDEVFGRFFAEAQLYIVAAHDTQDQGGRSRYLVAAGEAEVRGGDKSAAENLFRQAIAAAPSERTAYQDLISQIYGSGKDLRGAQAVTNESIRNGVDPLQMYLALSAAAQSMGNLTAAEDALLRALAYQPGYRMYMQVGQFYLENQRLDQAVSMLQNATEVDPTSADGFYSLALAQERNYQYSDAEKSYARAASLSPRFRNAYAAFQRRVNLAGGGR